MLRAENLGVRIVVQKAESLTPRDEHGKLRLQKQTNDGTQRLRPQFRRSEDRARPIVSAHHRPRAAASREKVEHWLPAYLHHRYFNRMAVRVPPRSRLPSTPRSDPLLRKVCGPVL